jgi:hypothetical protein
MHLDDVAIGIVDEGLLPARQPTSHHHRRKGMFSSTHHESSDFVRENGRTAASQNPGHRWARCVGIALHARLQIR